MINMIKADLYRVFRGKGIYFAILLAVIMAGSSIYVMQPGYIGLTSSATTSGDSMVDDETGLELSVTNSISKTRKIIKKTDGYPLDSAIIGTNVNLYYMFIIIVVGVLVTDLSHSTAKNTLSSAISKKKYYLSKLFTCCLLCIGLVLLNNYGTYIFNRLINGAKFTAGIGKITKYTLLQLPIMCGIISLLVCMAFLLRKTAAFNAVSIPFVMATQVVIMGVSVLLSIKSSHIMEYEYQFMLSNLVTDATFSYVMKSITLAIIYIVVFNILGYNVFRKSEIK